MQVQFNHEAKTTGVLFVKYTHYLTVHVIFNEEELFLINQMNLARERIFSAPSRNFLGQLKVPVFTMRDLMRGPITMEFPNLSMANEGERILIEDLEAIKNALYMQPHNRNRNQTFEI